MRGGIARLASPLALGIDTGGTFTDLVALGVDGSVRVAKAPSTPDAPLGALLRVLDKAALAGDAIERIVHGTTVATNTVLQRRGAEVLYVTTAGFEDIPFIQRINRKSEYDLHWRKPRPLVRRRNCLEWPSGSTPRARWWRRWKRRRWSDWRRRSPTEVPRRSRCVCCSPI